MNHEELIQREYYAATANAYDAMHVAEDDEHGIALSYISPLLSAMGVRSVLDVGCGTGRALTFLKRKQPELSLHGVELVPELFEQAISKGIARTALVRGSGLDLPFAAQSFDAVIECGVLHHVRDPSRVVTEMMRVARKAVFLSDHNIFGQGRAPVRVLKLAFYSMGLWKLLKLIQTGGRGYAISDGDGLAYSYSVYFQYRSLLQWADRLIAIPIAPARKFSSSYWSPVLSSNSVLLCALRDPGVSRGDDLRGIPQRQHISSRREERVIALENE